MQSNIINQSRATITIKHYLTKTILCGTLGCYLLTGNALAMGFIDPGADKVKVAHKTLTITTTYQYDDNGNTKAESYSDGVSIYSRSYSYDALNRLRDSTSNHDGTQDKESYILDANGNILQSKMQGQTTTFNYGDTSSVNNIDELVNMRVSDGVNEKYKDNIPTGKHTYTFNYDNNENIITEKMTQPDNQTKSTTYYQFNSLNQLATFHKIDNSSPNNTYQYHYYADGLRSEKSIVDSNEATDPVYYYNNQEARVTLQYQNPDNTLSDFAGFEIKHNEPKESQLITAYQNRQNNPATYTQGGGLDNLAAEFKTAYGQRVKGRTSKLEKSFKQINDLIQTNPYAYGTGFKDQESGLIYLHARYYNPKTLLPHPLNK